MRLQYLVYIMVLGCCLSCQQSQQQSQQVLQKPIKVSSTKDSLVVKTKREPHFQLYTQQEQEQFTDSSFVLIRKIDSTFTYDIKYATTDNFLKEQVYDCDECLLRYATVKQLLKAHKDFKQLGYRIQFFDCYRPLSIQEKMWQKFPDKRYVADPKKGSNHNRGTAVDITLVDSLGNVLEMGTTFDHFGVKAHHAYSHLPKQTLKNRQLLKSVMESHGFWSITSEWWHYNLNASYRYSISDFKTACDD
ncbi:MAG: D-alanyl-D-alanine dipeptidase [Flavobacteriaceae bacterium]